jgi:hypothetical protein
MCRSWECSRRGASLQGLCPRHVTSYPTATHLTRSALTSTAVPSYCAVQGEGMFLDLPSESTSAKTHCCYCPASRVFLDSFPAQNICSPGKLVFGLPGGGGAKEKLNSGSPGNLHCAQYRMWSPERRSIGCVLLLPPFAINIVNEAE